MSGSKDIEPYTPDFSTPATPEGQPPQKIQIPPKREDSPPGRRGCGERLLIYCMSFTVIMCVVVSSFGILGIGQTGKAVSDTFDGLSSFFGTKRRVNVTVVQVVTGFQEQKFLESVREEQSIDVTAEDQVRIGGIVGVPATRKLTYRAFVTVTAGIDLSLLEEGDITIDGTTIIIRLPQAQIKDCIIDLEASYYIRNYYCDTVGTCTDLAEILQDQVMMTAATEGNELILAQASTSAEAAIIEIAIQFGFTNIVIEQSETPQSPVAQGGSCPAPEPPIEPTPAGG